MKTYFQPRALRRGQPTLTFVKKEGNHYYLGTYHDIQPCKKPPYQGIGKEYNAVHENTISKELYDSLLKEARANHKRDIKLPRVRKQIQLMGMPGHGHSYYVAPLTKRPKRMKKKITAKRVEETLPDIIPGSMTIEDAVERLNQFFLFEDDSADAYAWKLLKEKLNNKFEEDGWEYWLEQTDNGLILKKKCKHCFVMEVSRLSGEYNDH